MAPARVTAALNLRRVAPRRSEVGTTSLSVELDSVLVPFAGAGGAIATATPDAPEAGTVGVLPGVSVGGLDPPDPTFVDRRSTDLLRY